MLHFVPDFVLRVSDLTKLLWGVQPLELALKLQSHRFNRWILYSRYRSIPVSVLVANRFMVDWKNGAVINIKFV
jgi:hypothetical protein